MRAFSNLRALLFANLFSRQLCIAFLGAMLFFSPAIAQPASPESGGDALPAEPFAATASEKPFRAEETISTEAATATDSVANSGGSLGAGALPRSDQKESFSLWDFFSRFFELGSPGDPAHPDKFRVTVGTNVGYDDNVFTTKTDQVASGTAGLNGTMSYNVGTERTKIASSLAVGTTVYENRPGDSTDYNGTFGLSGSHFFTRRLQVTGGVSLSYLSQPNATLIGGVSRFSGDYMVANVNLEVIYSVRPRVNTRVGFRLNAIKYTDAIINQGQGFSEQTYTLGLDYLLSPRTTLNLEYRLSPLSYYETNQNSVGHVLTVGFVTSFSPRLKWDFQAGAEARQLTDTGPQSGTSLYLGPFVETNVRYLLGPASSVTANMRYGTEPSGVSGISIRQTLRGGVSLTRAFGGRFVCDVGISYEHDNYDQPGDINDFTQEFYTAGVGLRYNFNPAFALKARYDYSAVRSEVESSEYARGISTLGLEIIF